MKLKTKVMTITLDNQQHDQIKLDAKNKNMSVSAFLRELHDAYTKSENHKKKRKNKMNKEVCGICNQELQDPLPYTQGQMHELSSHKGITAIIVTSYVPVKLFALSLLSLIANSNISEIIVCINGSFEEPEIGNEKQKLCFEIRDKLNLKLRVMRVWGHTGHSECIDGALAWVNTQDALLMHDDTIVLSRGWEQEAIHGLANDDVAAVVHQPAIHNGRHICHWDVNGKQQYCYPHLNCCFLIMSVAKLKHLKWQGQYVSLDDRHIGYDMGVWLWHRMQKEGLRIRQMNGYVHHVGGMTYRVISEDEKKRLIDVEQEAMATMTPELLEIYRGIWGHFFSHP